MVLFQWARRHFQSGNGSGVAILRRLLLWAETTEARRGAAWRSPLMVFYILYSVMGPNSQSSSLQPKYKTTMRFIVPATQLIAMLLISLLDNILILILSN